jgi:hypothetical protein
LGEAGGSLHKIPAPVCAAFHGLSLRGESHRSNPSEPSNDNVVEHSMIADRNKAPRGPMNHEDLEKMAARLSRPRFGGTFADLK